jgi:hypothetical protein
MRHKNHFVIARIYNPKGFRKHYICLKQTGLRGLADVVGGGLEEHSCTMPRLLVTEPLMQLPTAEPAIGSNRQRRRERQHIRYRQQFHQYQVEYFIRQEYPGCPEFAVVRFASQICTEPKNWRNATIADAVDHTIQNTLRHELTEYDQLLLLGVRRIEARRRVQHKIYQMIAVWRKKLQG